jgi:hypothetical protein
MRNQRELQPPRTVRRELYTIVYNQYVDLIANIATILVLAPSIARGVSAPNTAVDDRPVQEAIRAQQLNKRKPRRANDGALKKFWCHLDA